MRIFAIMNTFEHNKKRALLLAALGAIGVALVFLVKPDKKEWHKPAGIVWNTEYHITYLGTTDLSDSINATFRRFEHSVSPFNKASLITAVNDNRTDRHDSAHHTLQHIQSNQQRQPRRIRSNPVASHQCLGIRLQIGHDAHRQPD